MHHDINAPVDAFERHYRDTGVAPWVRYLRKYPLRAVGELLRDRVWLGTYTISPGVLSVRQFLSGADAQWLDAGLAAWLEGELAELAPSQFERNSAEGEYGIALYGAFQLINSCVSANQSELSLPKTQSWLATPANAIALWEQCIQGRGRRVQDSYLRACAVLDNSPTLLREFWDHVSQQGFEDYADLAKRRAYIQNLLLSDAAV